MSAQQPQHAPVRLLIAERSENAAHQFDSLLRDSGISTRLDIVDLPMAIDRINDADLMLCNAALGQLEQILPRLRSSAPHVPIILINSSHASLTTTEGLEMGASDVVRDSESRHLVLAVQRELEHVCQYVTYRQTHRALIEAEQRCQLLLQSSKAAIAYVHEGMHIYANEGYLKLFGFEDADDLLGLPLIDLLNSDSTDQLKSVLKQIRQDEEETTFDFIGASTQGESVSGNMTLAPADYEGEHCLQITVRTDALLESQVSPESVPLLTEVDAEQKVANAAAITDPVAVSDPQVTEATANGQADDSAEEPATENVDVENVDVENSVAQTNGSASAPDTDSGLPEAESAPAEHAGRAMTRNLGEFLDACEAQLTDTGYPFASVFVAQVDHHSQLQNLHGLAGAEEVCRQIEIHFQAILTEPFMQLSGNQWAMLVSADTRDSALDKADDYRQAIEALILEVNQKTIRPTVTLGGAILESEGHDSISTALEAALNSAFSTMKSAADASDGNTIKLPKFENANQAIDDEANRVLTLINEAIESQKFMLLFQPIISLRGDSDEHYEVFLRMIDRSGGQMTPGEFLRTAIDNGVAGKIDRWVILQSIKMLSAHRSRGHATRLTINLTANSVADADFIQWLGVAIKAARLPSDAVIFQITERDAAAYIRQTREFVEGLKRMHCRASLSRFGVESDPFDLLQHIPVDFVKLDGTLIEALNNDPGLKDDITTMIRDLQDAGKLTIVPMVESANVLSALWQAGANYIQGHYLQEPTTAMDYDFSSDD